MENTHSVVYIAANAEQAHILANILRDAGIFTYVANEPLRVAAGDLPFGSDYFVAPRVVVHRDHAAEARRIAVEFERATIPPQEAGRRRLEISTPTLLYIIAWAGLFATANAAMWGSPWRTFVNSYLLLALPFVTFIFLGYRKARRNWSIDPEESPGEGEAAGSADPDAERPKDAPLVPWPACPHCNRPRQLCCPICQTAGTNFPQAFMPEEDADGPSTGEQPRSVVFVLCPTCDEPFAAQFPGRCEWCGHQFRDGYESPVSAFPPDLFGADVHRMSIILIGLLLFLLAVVGYLAYLTR